MLLHTHHCCSHQPASLQLTNKMYLNRVKTVTLIFYFRYVHLLLARWIVCSSSIIATLCKLEHGDTESRAALGQVFVCCADQSGEEERSHNTCSNPTVTIGYVNHLIMVPATCDKVVYFFVRTISLFNFFPRNSIIIIKTTKSWQFLSASSFHR